MGRHKQRELIQHICKLLIEFVRKEGNVLCIMTFLSNGIVVGILIITVLWHGLSF